MVSLRDIGPLRRTVTIREQNIQIGGLTARGICELIDRFPAIRKMFSGRGNAEFTVESVMQLAPQALGAIVAAGMGNVGDLEEEAFAQELTVGEQAEIIAAMLELTFPKGLGHFAAILDTLGVARDGSDGTGWGQDMRLPPQFAKSFDSVSTQSKPSGDTLPESSQDGPSSSIGQVSQSAQAS